MADDPRRGSWIPWVLAGLFGIVVAVNAIMIWFATSSWTGMATEGAYQKGLDYNRNLQAASDQAALGWTVDIDVALVEASQGEIGVLLLDREGKPLERAEIAATFERPTHEGADFTVDLQPRGAGRYGAGLEAMLPGAWNVHTVVRRGEQMMVHDSRHELE